MRPTNLFLILLAGAALGACGGGSAAPGQGDGATAPVAAATADPSLSGVRWRPTEIADSGLNGMRAFTVQAPEGWTVVGTVMRDGCAAGAYVALRATSPDGRLAAEVFPRFATQWFANDPTGSARLIQSTGCIAAPPMNARDFITRVVLPSLRPGAQPVTVETPPSAQAHLQQIAQLNAQIAGSLAPGAPAPFTGDSARARLRYQSGAAQVEEWIVAPVTTLEMRTQITDRFTSTATVISARAPAGELDRNEALFRAIFTSVQADPQWSAAIAQAQRQQSQQTFDAAMANARAQSAQTQAQSDAFHRQNQEFQRYIGDRQVYTNPNTGQRVELPAGSGPVYSNGQGQYVQGQQGEDPNATAAPGTTYTPMQPVPTGQ